MPLDLAEAQAQRDVIALVVGFFQGDEAKASQWLNTPNPLLGHVAPMRMMAQGRSQKLLAFVRTELAENDRP